MKKLAIILFSAVLGISGANLMFYLISLPSTICNILAIAVLFLVIGYFNFIINKFFK